MNKQLENFLNTEELLSFGVLERLIAIIWWLQTHDCVPVEFSKIELANDEAGYAKINRTRERERLRKDPRTTSSDKGASFRIKPSVLRELNDTYTSISGRRELPKSNSLIEISSFEDTRGYIVKVVKQINLSYDYSLYNCCAVMIRRLLETLVIETYEKLGRADELKGRDGHFLMFSGLINILENDASLNIGRQSMAGLKSFKLTADSSAHNRRFNASRKDIDDKIDGIRLAVSELRQLAFDK